MLHTLLADAPLTNTFIFAFAFFLIALLRFACQSINARLILRHIPGPPPSSFIWGEEWRLYNSTPGSLYATWHNQFGKVVKFRGAFGHQVLSITDPRAISFIVGGGIYSFPKPRGVRAWFVATVGKGILWVEGKAAHEKQRRILAPALSLHSVRNLTPIFHETSTKLASQWMKMFDRCHVDELEIEITNWAARYALDTVGRAAFSYDFDCLSGNPHPLAEALDGLTNSENSLSSFYMRALFWIFPPVLRIGRKGEMIRRTKQELGEIALKMWRDAKVACDLEDKTLMASMLKAERAAGQVIDEEEIVSQMRSTISAGYETVSAIVAWVLFELSQRPEMQRELREEVSTARESSCNDLNSKYPLLDAVLKETLRLHPAILENHHEAIETMSIPLSEPLPGTSNKHIVVPKGTLLAIPLNVVHTNPEIWGSDAHIFRPRRWVERKGAGIRCDRELLTFSEGPRSCIGKAFAVTEIKVLIITLLCQFSFSCPYDIEAYQSFVIRPRIKGQGHSSLPLLVRKL